MSSVSFLVNPIFCLKLIIEFARMTGPDFVIMCTILNTIMQSVSLIPLGIKY